MHEIISNKLFNPLFFIILGVNDLLNLKIGHYEKVTGINLLVSSVSVSCTE